MKSRAVVIVFAILFLFIFPSNLRAGEIKRTLYQFKYSRFLMGTKVNLTLCTEDEASAARGAEEAFCEIERLEDLLSSWNKESEVSLINRSVATQWIRISHETFEVIAQSIQLSRDSGGAFDITVGVLKRIWRWDTSPQLPSLQEIKSVLPLVNFRLVQLDKKSSSVSLGKVGMEIDLGGIAKGYILEKAYKTLRRLGVDNGLIDGGGDVYCWGVKLDGSKWEVGVANPLSPSTYLAIVTVSNKAVFTSGDYERKFTQKGTTYHHIFDPRTGYPATLCHGVTVIGDTIPQVNGLSSTVFILGPTEGLKFLKKHPGVEAIITSKKGEVICSLGFKKKYPHALR